MNFALGQRWISDTESDLGLGTLVGIDGRMLTVLFPATGETRQYAQAEAPLTRVSFNVGDEIKSADGFSLVVTELKSSHNTLIYIGTRTDNGEPVELKETFLDHFISFSKPQDRLFAGQIDRFDNFTLRYLAWQQQNRQQQSPLRGLQGGRMSLIPHQLHIAADVASRHAPRVLLADEVGLGKTIEAGLIIHQQLLSGLASRVLIVVPESLQHQWLVEMLRRFNLHFSIFDEERCQQSQLDVSNPFDTAQLVLCSLEFISNNSKWLDQAQSSDWDLLVVDEAHHLAWSAEHVSKEYRCIESLAQDTAGVILLTATPDQLGQQSHFARLRLLDPDRFFDYQAFVDEQQQFQHIAATAARLLDNTPLNDELSETLQQHISEQDISTQLALLCQSEQTPAALQAREHLLSELLDRHGTGRILFRNSRASIKGFPKRQALPVALELPEQYRNALKVYHSLNSNRQLEELAQANLFPEQVFQAFEGTNSQWWQFDPRIDYLITLLKQHKPAKFLVICAAAATAVALEEALRQKEGVRAAVFHEGMSIVERDKAAAYFAQEDYSAQLLICSEIGSEGRNFQFAHHLVLFDLPLNPDLLEQRIGRLDRIGQQHDIQLHIPYFNNSAQQVLFDWYQHGLNAFAKTCQTGRTIYDQQSHTLLSLLASVQPDTTKVAQLVAQSQQQHQQLLQQLEQGRDKLLELNSAGGEKARQLASDIAKADADVQLPMLMFQAWDLLGVNQEDRSDTSIVLTPAEHLRCAYPGLEDDGVTVTFDRATALAQEDVQFLSWDHPMVNGTLDLLLNDNIGNTAVALLPNKALPVGSYFVELIYIIEASAPAKLQLSRYLPATPIRLLLDKTGKDLAAKVPFENFNRQLKPVGRQTASKLVNALQSLIHPMLGSSESTAIDQLTTLRQSALAKMQQALQTEQQRLIALKQINPLIRQDEIDMLGDRQQQLTDYINKARLKLDAVRLIVVSHD
ncbi:RNA polymerase-associated protein RapA [Arsukibacterium indicum]|uniref:RNA polymerase-associated protein RapA n=1 Tax=Arsukibacterium indicum TaxID=2848612 RepID=A0ABS6MJP7_9GAMM|nr:RNA polymerase-associated protein RapA [Arsukibacterium indicum]MBV2129046.1 RNA polymerase-associated protein RapA [Arsukibacterium indicum]